MFTLQSFFIFFALLMSAGTLAAPSPRRSEIPVRRESNTVTPLSSGQLSDLAPFTRLAGAAYCDSAKVKTWSCGVNCQNVPGFTPTLTGGDGGAEQFFFVGYLPSQSSVIVAHEGTDPLEIQSDLTDLNIAKTSLNPTLFPGAPDDIEVHKGFSDEHALTGGQILDEVKKLLAANNAKKVTLVGHSLGGALAELDTLMMKLNLPADVTVKGVTFGTPRVGNDKFAAFFDSKINGDFQRINNDNDPVPILPGRFLGFSHVAGEVHLLSPGKAVFCSGDDDADDADCTIKTVPNIFNGNILDHLGPYEGISMGTVFCDNS